MDIIALAKVRADLFGVKNVLVNSNSINADLNKLQQDNSSSGQATNHYTITTSLCGSPDNGKGFGLLNRYTSTPASPQYEVKATKSSSYSYMGESKILALCKLPKARVPTWAGATLGNLLHYLFRGQEMEEDGIMEDLFSLDRTCTLIPLCRTSPSVLSCLGQSETT